MEVGVESLKRKYREGGNIRKWERDRKESGRGEDER